MSQQSPGPLRLLTFLRVDGSLGLRESPNGPAKSQATEATDISQGRQVTGPLGKSGWPGKVRATEATDISQSHWVTWPLGKSRWPGKVPGH